MNISLVWLLVNVAVVLVLVAAEAPALLLLATSSRRLASFVRSRPFFQDRAEARA